MLKEQDVAPVFETISDTGKTIQLSDYQGQWVVLYFFPKVLTSG